MFINGTLVFLTIGWTINAATFQSAGDLKSSLLNAGLANAAGLTLLYRLTR